ncbi:U6 snRNA phosphodiesterase Usb1 [Dendryphion nanum]|uniref:U6 snRNA phosphodiesterase n=1 Tax=Dendryphion nanum TaxID=256645 RepID=A0A9P9ILM3_9PLEO|nr:U6 snRNA phosphodiesterase Usb1 [Dendryphion nanum]
MSLVLYPDSDPDDTDGQGAEPAQPCPSRPGRRLAPHSLKRKNSSQSSELPPLPSAFHDLYSANARTSNTDNPALHGGRKRAIPHVEGNWPSHLYLEWVPSRTESDQLLNLIYSVQEAIASANALRSNPLPIPDITPSLLSPLGAPLPLHISLSRTLQIKTEDRDDFLDTLTSSLRKSGVRPFEAQLTSLKWVPNYERNRWFLVLGIEKPSHDELNKLLEACNSATGKCGHPGLYIGGGGDGPMEDNTSQGHVLKRRRSSRAEKHRSKATPVNTTDGDRSDRFHISIAWNLVEPDPEWVTLVGNVDVVKLAKSPATIPFDAVKARIGNTVHSIPLATKTSALGKSTGILGLGPLG